MLEDGDAVSGVDAGVAVDVSEFGWAGELRCRLRVGGDGGAERGAVHLPAHLRCAGIVDDGDQGVASVDVVVAIEVAVQ